LCLGTILAHAGPATRELQRVSLCFRLTYGSAG